MPVGAVPAVLNGGGDRAGAYRARRASPWLMPVRPPFRRWTATFPPTVGGSDEDGGWLGGSARP
jgi:hypothetical protein